MVFFNETDPTLGPKIGRRLDPAARFATSETDRFWDVHCE
jgi:hypothetical protein